MFLIGSISCSFLFGFIGLVLFVCFFFGWGVSFLSLFLFVAFSLDLWCGVVWVRLGSGFWYWAGAF